MIRAATLAAALAAVITLPAIAQDVKAPATTAQTAITEQEAKNWVDKPVYSNDGKKLGEVAAILRSADQQDHRIARRYRRLLGPRPACSLCSGGPFLPEE